MTNAASVTAPVFTAEGSIWRTDESREFICILGSQEADFDHQNKYRTQQADSVAAEKNFCIRTSPSHASEHRAERMGCNLEGPKRRQRDRHCSAGFSDQVGEIRRNNGVPPHWCTAVRRSTTSIMNSTTSISLNRCRKRPEYSSLSQR